jgi:hypothetical protein
MSFVQLEGQMGSIFYGNLRIEILDDDGARVDRLTPHQAPPGLTWRPSRATKSAPALLLGRDEQLDQVRRAIQAQRPIEFNATCGYGKSTLLRYVAASVVTDSIASSCVYLSAGHDDVEDLLGNLVQEFYTADQPVKPTPDQCAQLLGQVRAVIVLDDVVLDPEQVYYVLRVLPGCTLVIGSARPILGRHGSSQTLAGLPDDAALQLVASDLGRPLTSRRLPAVQRLAAAVDGQPLHLRQAAALVREDRLSFATLASKADQDPEVLDRLSISALAERERRALAVLALAAGALLPTELVGVMGDIAQIGETLGLLHRRGLAEQREDRFGLPACKVEGYRRMLLKDLHLTAALRELVGWLAARDPIGADATSAASAALAIIGFAAERGEWPAVVRLVRVVEPILTLAGRWEASRRILEQGLQAATATGDQAAEALFSHQKGTLALCHDELTVAKRLLERALALRERLGDWDGAELTRHNLHLLQPVAPPPPPRRAAQPPRRLVVGIGSALAVVLLVIIGVVKTINSSPTQSRAAPATVPPAASATQPTSPPPPGGPSATGGQPSGPHISVTPVPDICPDTALNQKAPCQMITITSTGSAPLRVGSLDLHGLAATEFQVNNTDCLARPLAPDKSCFVKITFLPKQTGLRTAALIVHQNIPSPDTGTPVGLIGDGISEPTTT